MGRPMMPVPMKARDWDMAEILAGVGRLSGVRCALSKGVLAVLDFEGSGGRPGAIG